MFADNVSVRIYLNVIKIVQAVICVGVTHVHYVMLLTKEKWVYDLKSKLKVQSKEENWYW